MKCLLFPAALTVLINGANTAYYVFKHQPFHLIPSDATEVWFYASQIGGIPGGGVFSHLHHLQNITFWGTLIMTIEPGAFLGLDSLTSLNLPDNWISTIDSETFAGLPSLSRLNLGNNGISIISPATFQNLPSLTYLNLYGNRIQVIEPGAFNGLVSLQELRLYNNRLKNLPPGVFSELHSLRMLLLNGNRIQKIEAETFTGLHSLEELWLHDNFIGSIEPFAFSGLASLKELYLHNNYLVTLQWNIFNPQDFAENGGHPESLRLSLSDNILNCDSRMQWLKLGEEQGWIYWYTWAGVTYDPKCVNSILTKWDDMILPGNTNYTCPAGQLNNIGTLECKDCGYGFYQNQENQMLCHQCPEGKTTPVTNATDFAHCLDIDCEVNNGGCSDFCNNTNVMSFCSCPEGWTLGQNNLQCQDVNECLTSNGGCSHVCHNTDGSFHCQCPAGYNLTSDGLTCGDVDECADNNGGCSHSCINTQGSFVCECPTGWKIAEDKKTCFRCPRGTFWRTYNCLPCPVGTYNNVGNHTMPNCIPCLNLHTTQGTGSVSVSQCTPLKQ